MANPIVDFDGKGGRYPFKMYCLDVLLHHPDGVELLSEKYPDYAPIVKYYDQQLTAFFAELDAFITSTRNIYNSYLDQPQYDTISAKAETVAQIKGHKFFGYALGTMTNNLYSKDFQFSTKVLAKHIPDYVPYLHTINWGNVSSNKVVGWCKYKLHPGAMFTKHLEKHECLKKECAFLQKNPDHTYWKAKINGQLDLRKDINARLKKAYTQNYLTLDEYNICKMQVQRTKMKQLPSLAKFVDNYIKIRKFRKQ